MHAHSEIQHNQLISSLEYVEQEVVASISQFSQSHLPLRSTSSDKQNSCMLFERKTYNIHVQSRPHNEI